MPLYEYECQACGKHEDAFRPMAEHDKGPDCCGQMMRQVIAFHVRGDIEPYIDENIGDTPTLVKSRKHREQLMKQHGVKEHYGKGWI